MRRTAVLVTLVASSFLLAGSASAQLTIGSVTPGSRLALAGLQAGDVVYFVSDPSTKPSPKGPRSPLIKSVAQLESEINLVRSGAAALIYKRPSFPIRTADIAGPAGPTGVVVTPLPTADYAISITTGRDKVSPQAIENLVSGLLGGGGNVFKGGDGPGTDAKVTIDIVGTKGQVRIGPIFAVRNGYQMGKDLFELGSTDTLQITGVDVGVMKGVTIQRDNTNPLQADWQINRIVVTKTPTMGAPVSLSWGNGIGSWLLDQNGKSYPLN